MARNGFQLFEHKFEFCLDKKKKEFFGYIETNFGMAAPVAKRLRALFLNYSIFAVSGVGSSPALATGETNQVLLVGVPGGFS